MMGEAERYRRFCRTLVTVQVLAIAASWTAIVVAVVLG